MAETTSSQLARQGKKAYEQADYAAAAQVFEQAAAACDAEGAALDAAEMRNNASVSWLQHGNAQKALDVLAGTAALFEAANDLRRYGLALGNEGAALEALKRTDEAIARYTLSSEVLEQAGEDQLRAEVLKTLSALQLKTGKQIDAVISMQSGLAGIKKPTLQQKLLKKLLRFRP